MNIYTPLGIRKFTPALKNILGALGLALLVFTGFSAKAQKGGGLEVPVKLETDKGNAENIHLLVLKNGKESFTQNASKSLKLKLEYNQVYTLSFSKDGFVTKTIEVNTNAPAERIKQGFEPYKIGIKLFAQQDGNTIMYNQPVGKIRYEESLDDFNYETDYSKSILSGFESPAKKDSVEKEKEPAPVAEKKAEPVKEKKVPEKQAEKEDKALITASVSENDKKPPVAQAELNLTKPAAGESEKTMASVGSGSSDPERSRGASGADHPDINRKVSGGADAPDAEAELQENLTITKEEITEKNRIIIKVKVSSDTKETMYSVVQYNWGGRYFFKETTSINETLFTHWTGVRL